MSIYTFTNTERNNKKATEFETKSLLYLVGFRKDRDQVDLFTIDCFNDVTGIDKSYNKLWDIQSKNYSKFYPKQIGEFLFTLYKNHISGFSFCCLILFVPKLNKEYLIQESLDEFGIDNFQEETKLKIKDGLIDKVKNNIGRVNKKDVESFFKKIIFVQDSKDISDYIKRITKFKDRKIRDNDFYQNIFEEIRNVQSSKKNSCIENEQIEKIEDVLKFNRHLFKKEIYTLIINRILGCDVFEYKSIPISFKNETDDLDTEATKDLIQDCKANLARAFFNKNSNPEFWKVLEFVINQFDIDPKADIYKVHSELERNINIKSRHLDRISLLFIISIIKDHIYAN
ncbi:MAG: hypothetical protein WCQ96_04325 [Patescibacteria group bacterium]